ncbi:MAG: Flp pilus assembly protein CpaB [Planctomycetes bacterium]|nr:Flp pilus assembly protein CpaB [Planctomycetota bacterium]
MRPKSIMLLVLALGCGLVAAIGIRQIVVKNAQAAPEGDRTPIFVAMTDIKYSDKIIVSGEGTNVKLESWPSELVERLEAPLTQLEDIENAQASARIMKGSAIVEPMLMGEGYSNAAARTIPPGYRAYAIKGTSLTAIGDMPRPGDRVDVLLFVEKKELEKTGYNGIPTQVITILANIRVFAINGQTNREQFEETDLTVNIKNISLLVKRKQAERLAFAEELGKLRLILRGTSEETEESSDRDLSEGQEDPFGIFIAKREDEDGPVVDSLPDPKQQQPEVKPGPKPFSVVIWSGSTPEVWVQDLETKRMQRDSQDRNSTGGQPTTTGRGVTQGQATVRPTDDADLPQDQVDLTGLADEDEQQEP